MALEVRRIVTGHDSQGNAVVATDERLAGTGAAGRAGISRVDVWSTDKMPIDNSDAASELQRKGFVVRHNYVGSGQAKFPTPMARLEPLYAAAADLDLAVVLYTFTVMPPYAPGGQDTWDNLWLQRSAAHPWCGMR